MSNGVNKVILIGNLGDDPQVRYSQSGSCITAASVATSESWIDKSTKKKQDSTEWHRVVFFGKLAEIVGEYVRKGSKIYVEGSIRTRKWRDQTGQDRYSTEVVGKSMQILSSKTGQTSNGQDSQQFKNPTQQCQDVPDSFDDDIPF